jgi:hypothetical protein
MVDPGTAIELVIGATGVKVLGPTASYVGEGIKEWTERRVANVQRVFKSAEDKLGAELDRPGAVPPRVLKAVLDQAQFAEDELVAEYLGGVLASSRSEVGRDDRAAATAALIGRLSSYALRTHYVLYAAARPAFVGAGVDFHTGYEGDLLFISESGYDLAMEFSEAEDAMADTIIPDVMFELSHEELIQPYWVCGKAEQLRGRANADAPDAGYLFKPSQRGVILYCVALGVHRDPLSRFTETDPLPTLPNVTVPDALIVPQLSPFPTAPAPSRLPASPPDRG